MAHQQGYQLHSSLLSPQMDLERDDLLEELQATLEEQEVLHQELEEQAHLNREARLAQLHLAAIVASSEEPILSKDLDGIVTSWNEAAQRLYGYSAQEMVGQSVALIFPPDRQQELTQIMEQIRRGERVGNYETIRMRKDRSLVPVSVTISPIKESDGTIIGASAIAHDITPRRELERQREAFVDLVTHELKTPLTALSGNIQLAQRLLTRLLSQPDHLAPEQQQTLEQILTMLGRSHQQMQMQKRLIDDLLDLSHVQQGTLQLHQERCDLLTLVYETVQDHQAAHPSRLITLDLPEQDQVLVYGDRDRLGQVLGNYLGNALKFAPVDKPIHVGMDLQAETVRVWVQDEGPGLTSEQKAHIWERYFQVSQTPVQSGWKVGLGLGLFICRQLIIQQDGEVGVESTPEQGATFWFCLPISRQT
ncbi:MAG TPA: PAS domain-containing sensor histidine kinase [Ktedonobacteraceae bacterium]|nr:PAS domain-containing sensor histidine kinase [Ktedonobacteraceae bacterium]